MKIIRRRRTPNIKSLRKRCVRTGERLALSSRLTSSQHSSGNQKAEEDAKKDTDQKVKEIQDIGSKSGSKVVDQLIAAVTNAKPEPPKKS